MSQLDNPVWSALTTRQRDLGQIRGRAARFDPSISPFAAFDGVPRPDHWSDLAELVGPSGSAALVYRDDNVAVRAPSDWTVRWRSRGLQMGGAHLRPLTARAGAIDDRPEPLGPDDVADMMALVDVARPGPFLDRTVEFGGYVGVRRHGQLVAMAGERLRLPGHIEISAVATSPDHRRQGLAELLVATVARSIKDRGETPILHVAEHNTDAIRLYEAMGFSVRTVITFNLVEAAVGD